MNLRPGHTTSERRCVVLIAAVMCIALLAAPTASSLNIVITNGANAAIGTPQRDAFEFAAGLWESVLTDPITIRLTLRFEPILGPGGQPSATRGITSIDLHPAFYRPVTGFPTSADGYAFLLNLDATSPEDATAVVNLQTDFALDFVVNTFTAEVFDGNPSDSGTLNRFFDDFGGNNDLINITPANARAVGAAVDALGNLFNDGVSPDGVIRMNSALVQISGQPAWDFDPSDGIDPLAVDYTGVAIHEIAHALGFQSGVDAVENMVLGDPANFLEPECEASFDGTNGISCVHVSVLDLFRFSLVSLGLDPSPPFSCPNCGPGVLDQLVGGLPYFSINGGVTDLAPFSSGVTLGDGFPPDHWTPDEGPYFGVMQGTSSRGERLTVTVTDLIAMDVIGWDLPVPEPTGALPVALLWLVGIASRRARSCDPS